MSLTKKLVLAFLLVSLIPLGVIIAVSGRSFVKQAQHEIGMRLEDSVLQAGKSMDEFLLNCLRDTKSIASDPDLSSRDNQVINEHLSRFIGSFPYFDQVMLVDAGGRIVASSNRPSAILLNIVMCGSYDVPLAAAAHTATVATANAKTARGKANCIFNPDRLSFYRLEYRDAEARFDEARSLYRQNSYVVGEAMSKKYGKHCHRALVI
jgi:hypothetical protein